MADKGAGPTERLATSRGLQALIETWFAILVQLTTGTRLAHEGAETILTAPIPVGHRQVAIIPRTTRRAREAKAASWLPSLKLVLGRPGPLDGAEEETLPTGMPVVATTPTPAHRQAHLLEDDPHHLKHQGQTAIQGPSIKGTGVPSAQVITTVPPRASTQGPDQDIKATLAVVRACRTCEVDPAAAPTQG